MVVRAIIGRSWGQGAQHSQALHSFFMHTPGLKVAAPVTPHDAKGCMVSAIRDNNPVIFVEHKMLYKNKGVVPIEQYEIPFGKARKLTKGSDITIVAISYVVVEAIRASKSLEEVGIKAEVIDPVTLTPIDIETIVESVNKTRNLLVVDNGWICAGAASEIVAQVIESSKIKSRINIKRLGFAHTPCPTTKVLENHFYPNPESIAKEAYKMTTGNDKWIPKIGESREISEFKGPF